MARIPPPAIIGVVLFLVIGLSVGAFLKLIRPAQADLASLRDELQQEQEKAAQLEATQEELERKTEEWLVAKAKLDKLMEERSIPISWGQPFPAMVASLWPEMRRDLPEVVEKWVAAQGVEITSGASLPAPPKTPPGTPSNGFYELATINLGVTGTLSEIEKLYRALPEFPRVATISSLSLVGEGDTMSATLPMTIYLLVEVPQVEAAGGEGMMGMPGMGMPGMGMPGMGMPGMGGMDMGGGMPPAGGMPAGMPPGPGGAGGRRR